ncbi:MAG: hypothetical protein ABR562_03710 [Thermoplasmatota archaeon]
MTRIDIRIDDAELRKDLEERPREVQAALGRWRRVVGQLTRLTMRQVIKERSRTRTGGTIGSIEVEEFASGVAVGPTKVTGLFLQEGTRPHDISAKPGHWLAFARAGGFRTQSRTGMVGTKFTFGGKVHQTSAVFAKVVHHPGTNGIHFLEETANRVPGPAAAALERELQATKMGG